LYRAARGLREDGTIATWPSGESSNRQLVIARPGFKVRIPKVPRLVTSPSGYPRREQQRDSLSGVCVWAWWIALSRENAFVRPALSHWSVLLPCKEVCLGDLDVLRVQSRAR